MSDQDIDDDEPWDAALFDVEGVQWKVLPTRRVNECTIKFYDDPGTQFTLIKIYLSVVKLAEQLQQELNILGDSEGEH